jgi:hypothetical protein
MQENATISKETVFVGANRRNLFQSDSRDSMERGMTPDIIRQHRQRSLERQTRKDPRHHQRPIEHSQHERQLTPNNEDEPLEISDSEEREYVSRENSQVESDSGFHDEEMEKQQERRSYTPSQQSHSQTTAEEVSYTILLTIDRLE